MNAKSPDTAILTADLAAAAVLARIAWPNENDECQARWAPRLTDRLDAEIRENTYRRALEKASGSAELMMHVLGAAYTLGITK